VAPIPFATEAGKTRAFGWAVDWPGWCRSARDGRLLPAALIAAAPRYAIVAAQAGVPFNADPGGLTPGDLELVATVDGSAGTDFGVPSGIAELDRHLDRMGQGAARFEFRFDRHGARNELQAATFGRKDAAMVRLLLSPSGAMAIQVKRLERPSLAPVTVTLAPMPVAGDDIRRRYKTTDRRFYDQARRANDSFETIFVDPDGRLTEGSFTNIFVERDGRLLTPPAARGLIPGVLRAKLIDEGRAVEAELVAEDLGEAFYVGNILRGLMRARLV